MPDPEVLQEFLSTQQPVDPDPPRRSVLDDISTDLRARAEAVLTQPAKPLHGLLLEMLRAMEELAADHHRLAGRVLALEMGPPSSPPPPFPMPEIS